MLCSRESCANRFNHNAPESPFKNHLKNPIDELDLFEIEVLAMTQVNRSTDSKALLCQRIRKYSRSATDFDNIKGKVQSLLGSKPVSCNWGLIKIMACSS